MNTPQLVIALISIIAALIGAYISLRLTGRLFARKKFTPVNAVELLKAGHPEEWNEVRILNPEWVPDLQNADFSYLVIPSANFQGANLDHVSFNQAVLDGCDFLGASLKFANFEKASAVGARFDASILDNTNFDGALLDRASFKGVLNETQIPAEIEVAPINIADVKRQLELVVHDPTVLDRMSPWQFEDFVSFLFESTGYKVVRTVEGRDRGFDLIAVRDDPIKGQELYIVESKKYNPNRLVGVSPLRALYAQSIENNADHAVLVTSSKLTKDAQLFVQTFPNIEIIDRQSLLRLATKVHEMAYQ